MNGRKEGTGVYAGDRTAANRAGCGEVRRHATVPVSQVLDVVVTSNARYPLDLNLYQSVKGMSAAARVVRRGGDIIVAAECWDGIPDHGLLASLIAEAQDPGELLRRLRTDQVHVRVA